MHHRKVLQSTWGAFVDRTSPAFYLIDAAAPVRRLIYWNRFLPAITPYYAVKCNPDLMIVTALAAAGASFDVASPAEIDLVLAAGVPPAQLNDRVIFANPTKAISAVEHAARAGVFRMTADSEEEVLKCIAATGGRAQIVVRLAVDNTGSLNPLGKKFGSSAATACRIVDLCVRLKAPAIGVSFHVGSAATDPAAYGRALARCRAVFEYAAARGAPMRLIDLGGGWPGSDTAENVPVADEHDKTGKHTEPSAVVAGLAPHPPFPFFAEGVMEEVEKYFPKDLREARGVALIAEPGRFMATSATTLVCEIIAKKVFYDDDTLPLDATAMLMVGPGTPTAFNGGTFGMDAFASPPTSPTEPVTATIPVGASVGVSSGGSECSGGTASDSHWPAMLGGVDADADPAAIPRAKRKPRTPVRVHYHLSDGVYGGMNSALTDRVRPLPHVLFERGRVAQAACRACEGAIGGFGSVEERACVADTVPMLTDALQMPSNDCCDDDVKICVDAADCESSAAAVTRPATGDSAPGCELSHTQPCEGIEPGSQQAKLGSRARGAAQGGSRSVRWLPSSLYGPTCDDLDVINHGVLLPSDLRIGEWLYFRSFGAYTQCLETRFNGFAPPARYYSFTMPDRWALERCRRSQAGPPVIIPQTQVQQRLSPPRYMPGDTVAYYARDGAVVGAPACTPAGPMHQPLEWAYRRFVLPTDELGDLVDEAGEWTVIGRKHAVAVPPMPQAAASCTPPLQPLPTPMQPSPPVPPDWAVDGAQSRHCIRLRQQLGMADVTASRFYRPTRHLSGSSS